MIDSNAVLHYHIQTILTEYYGECERINEMLDNEDVSEAEAEDMMFQMDKIYAQRVIDSCVGKG